MINFTFKNCLKIKKDNERKKNKGKNKTTTKKLLKTFYFLKQ